MCAHRADRASTYRFDCEVVSLAQSIFRVTTGLNEATKGERATPSIHREQMRTANARHEDYSSKSCFCPKHIRTLTNIHRFYPLATTTPITFFAPASSRTFLASLIVV